MNNRNAFPKTLIQIHYHDKPCGVMQVIRYYARAFESINQKKIRNNILICEKLGIEKYPEYSEKSIVSLPEAGYRTFKNRKEFINCRKIIIDKIASLLLSKEIRLPVVIMAHNLTLCKNAALVSAFADLAAGFASQKNGYRFFSVAHDFAQEGRVEQLREIARLEKMGISVREEIAAAGAPVHFIAVHPRAKNTLEKAGFKVSLLSNPVTASPMYGTMRDNAKQAFTRCLTDYSKSDGILFKPERPVFSYPVRTIARKNPFEAIALACIANDANLLLGGPGSSKADKKRHARIKELARGYRLPVITGIQEFIMRTKALRVFTGDNPVPLLYACTDRVLTCSKTEGFGYLLHEPWLYDIPVCGRRPTGFDSIGKTSGTCLYDFLPISADWVDKKIIKKKYRSVAATCFSDKKRQHQFISRVDDELKKPFIDFAFLDEKSQIGVIKKLLSSQKTMISWRELLKKPMKGWPGLSVFNRPSQSVIQDNINRIEKQFSMKKFSDVFEKCLRIIPRSSAVDVDWNIVEKEYGDIRKFGVRD